MEPNVNPTNVPAPQPAANPEPAPAPQPAPQPAPTPGISTMPNFPAPEPAPAQPEPQPIQNPEPAPQPQTQEPQNPATPPVPENQPKQLTYDEYLDSLTANIKPTVEAPNVKDIPADDPDGLVKFFDDFKKSTIEEMRVEQQRSQVIQQAEQTAWQEVFTKYPEVQNNPTLRDTVHNIRMGAYQRGQSLSPIQVTDALIGTLHQEYKRGVNDTNVQTRIQDSQPLNGGGNPPAQPVTNLESLQAPGQAGVDAAVTQIQAMIDAGRI